MLAFPQNVFLTVLYSLLRFSHVRDQSVLHRYSWRYVNFTVPGRGQTRSLWRALADLAPLGGKCLDNTQSAHGVLDCIPKDSDSQKWTIETDPKDPNVVAFKSSVDGQYLRNNEPAKIYAGRIGVGEKQWWTLEKGKNPGSCLIRSNACTAGASYLNDFEGRYQDRNYVHMW